MSAPTVPQGWKLVPIEPTHAMVRAACDAMGATLAIKAAIAAAPTVALPAAVGEWQPIETAPMNGRTLLLGSFNACGNWRTMRGQWFSKETIDDEWGDPDDAEEGWYETAVVPDEPNCWPIKPTHWMPLPAAPSARPSEVAP